MAVCTYPKSQKKKKIKKNMFCALFYVFIPLLILYCLHKFRYPVAEATDGCFFTWNFVFMVFTGLEIRFTKGSLVLVGFFPCRQLWYIDLIQAFLQKVVTRKELQQSTNQRKSNTGQRVTKQSLLVEDSKVRAQCVRQLRDIYSCVVSCITEVKRVGNWCLRQ